MPSNSQSGRISLVTGASRGIGYATALEIAKRGGTVIALARTVGGLEALDDEIRAAGGKAVLIPVDLQEQEQLSRLPAALQDRFGRLDGLVLNAGLLGPLTPVTDILGKEWHETFVVNLHANLALLQLLHPLLVKSDAVRVVGITSGAATKVKPFWGAYAASKAAFNALLKSYAAENVEREFKVNLLDPGPTATVMRADAMPGEDPNTITQPSEIAEWITDLLDTSTEKNGEIISYPRPWDAIAAQ
ncbi:MAG: SDR family NAD(P)-dependent oxidoreductase [Pseudomonadota bacterium]